MAGSAKLKQQQLEGVKEKRVQEIEDAMEAYVEARDGRMNLLDKEIELKEKLMEAMKKAKEKTYRFSTNGVSYTAKLENGKPTVKVKKKEESE